MEDCNHYYKAHIFQPSNLRSGKRRYEDVIVRATASDGKLEIYTQIGIAKFVFFKGDDRERKDSDKFLDIVNRIGYEAGEQELSHPSGLVIKVIKTRA